MKRIHRDQGACTCHQASGDSWDCPEHYQDNPRFRDTSRIVELCTGHLPAIDFVFTIIRKIDEEKAERSKEFYRKLNEELDRRGL